MSRVIQVIICRPSISGSLDIVVSCQHELPLIYETIQREPPSEFECVRLITQRVKIHFSNRGKIELDGFILFYSVNVEQRDSLVYICVGEGSLGFDDAQQFLDSLQSIVASCAQSLSQSVLQHPVESLLSQYLTVVILRGL